VNDGTGFTIHAVGTVASPRVEATDDDWGTVESTITLVPPYSERSLLGLDEFSHVEVVYVFDRVDPASVTIDARIPRENPAWPEVGIFAQRGRSRPNRLGVSICEVVAVEGASVRVRGLDAIDGTPVVDLKPHMAEFEARGPVRQPRWSRELMAGYW
jgi:tRNA-Thr(GGU) m(6)t(6)A37 methyltransferase TsaA